MQLKEAFDITRGDVVAFIGAGGKTSTLIGLGYELAEQGWRVLATTTATMQADHLNLLPNPWLYRDDPQALSEALSQHRFVFVYDHVRGERLYGPAVDWTRRILDQVDSDVLLVEADRAGGLPLKAHRDNEPIIPQETTLVIPIASLTAINQPLDDEHIYNSKAMVEKYGFHPGSQVRSPWIAQVLRDEELGLRGVPAQARIVAFINRTPANHDYLRGRARLIARLLLKSTRIQRVAIGSVRSSEPVIELQRPLGAVVLAAGQSRRMGEPKMLLPWANGRTIIEHIVHQLTRMRLAQINVVTGYYAEEVKARVKPMDVHIVHNRAHRTGEMLSSLKAGLRAMPDHIAAAMIFLGDQPRIEQKTIYQVMSAYAEGAGDIVAPSYQRRRGHPIIVARKYWPEFLALRNDRTPREVLNAHADEIAYVNVDTDSILRDIDTPDDYEDERFRAGLRRRP